MLDIAWPELVVVGAVALVAIGPKDLPKVMRTIGRWAAKARNLMHDVRHTFEQLSYEADIAEKLQKEINSSLSPDLSSTTTASEKQNDRPNAS